jgi:putative Holliday junction resolvase
MAKLLGIDYGSKKIGISLSDEGGMIAFPEAIIKNSPKAIDEIGKIIKDKGVQEIVLGLPLDLSGDPNKIMKETGEFKEKLEEKFNLPIYFEKEFMTSSAALHMDQYMKGVRPDTARKVKREEKQIDDSAAALILQRYLDKKNAI